MLCGACWANMRFIEHPRCRILGAPLAYDSGFETTSLTALADPPVFDRLRSVAVFNDISGALVRRLKFGDEPELARWMAHWMVRAGKELLVPGVTIVPVPLHRQRLVRRRFNQSAELARHLALQANGTYKPELLQRIRPTRQQVGLGARQRQRNVRGAFISAPEHEIHIRGKHLILVDDVYTTGATLQACSRALRRKGAAKIDCLTFAQVASGVANGHQ